MEKIIFDDFPIKEKRQKKKFNYGLLFMILFTIIYIVLSVLSTFLNMKVLSM